MKQTEIVKTGDSTPMLPTEMQQALAPVVEVMRGMADMVRATNERMAALEQQVRLLTKVTPAQASAINEAIRGRAAELCVQYHAEGCEKAAANAIRRAVRLITGVTSVRELPRCEYSIALEQVRMWDDYKAMRAIRNKHNQ